LVHLSQSKLTRLRTGAKEAGWGGYEQASGAERQAPPLSTARAVPINRLIETGLLNSLYVQAIFLPSGASVVVLIGLADLKDTRRS